jgi:hypothetical protein
VVHDVIVRKTRRWPITKTTWHTEESQTVNRTDVALLRAGSHFGEAALLSGEVCVSFVLHGVRPTAARCHLFVLFAAGPPGVSCCSRETRISVRKRTWKSLRCTAAT